ncbi:hypothetical protein EJ05DRAFT_257368 [Pseudovirgaria hyperparasitica]|uniref:DUF676 domain-containing protein n=1 Tax=Pseudovirgaria hyperparasitica TaxID=470096 RepID=A0A6A6WEI5_9PEZI|nr:uncharacterized protein EJ05DRAFT_257368 [Pseudovirgaria hyperparasitica]KAF2761238.1 hypothetical protein EJ05DRAFT_257368 [Pseudovirgaria hyperparasitica]
MNHDDDDTNKVIYIPHQSNADARLTTDRAATKSPFRLLLVDIAILFKNLRYLPWVLTPIRSPDSIPGVPPTSKWHKIRDYTLVSIISLVEVIIIPLSFLVFLALPGLVFCLYIALVCLLVYLFEHTMWGPLVLHSTVPLPTSPAFVAERWLYINGIGTSSRGLQLTLNRLAGRFKRPVVGVHNRSAGIPMDVLECILQRCLGYSTTDVRTAHEYLKLQLCNDAVRKVVVVAHSQGGIITALALDRLFVELAAHEIAKLEVYTFGSAASHFNDPHLSVERGAEVDGVMAMRRVPGVRTIEHYMNEFDLVPRWGVKYSTSESPNQRYAGRVFINRNATGHLFDEHYLDIMFPLREDGELEAGGFLDDIVEIEERPSRVPTPEGDLERYVEDGGIRWVMSADDAPNGGRSVRELSKLWRYVNGGTT